MIPLFFLIVGISAIDFVMLFDVHTTAARSQRIDFDPASYLNRLMAFVFMKFLLMSAVVINLLFLK